MCTGPLEGVQCSYWDISFITNMLNLPNLLSTPPHKFVVSGCQEARIEEAIQFKTAFPGSSRCLVSSCQEMPLARPIKGVEADIRPLSGVVSKTTRTGAIKYMGRLSRQRLEGVLRKHNRTMLDKVSFFELDDEEQSDAMMKDSYAN